MLGFFRNRSTNVGFWQWLADNTSRIQSGGGDVVVGQQIEQAFDAEYPDLTWEISPAKTGPWLFCVSANGNKELFPKVQQAVRAAREIPGWKVQAFRPRGSLNAVLEMGGHKLGYDDIWCSVERQSGGLAVTLWIRGLDEQTLQVLGGAALVLLDNAIGEYDAVTKIVELKRGPLPSNPQETATFFPLSLLPAYLDAVAEP